MSIDLEYWLASNRLSRSDRARLEQELADSGRALVVHEADGPRLVPESSWHLNPGRGESYENFRIDGPTDFVRATKKALGLLRGTSAWPWMAHVTRIGTCDTGGLGGGWCVYTEVEFTEASWRDDAREYAARIAHEAVHASGVDGSGAGEAKCLGVQAQALRELGAPRASIERIERMAANPTPFHLE
jgi:hypothetical protein